MEALVGPLILHVFERGTIELAGGVPILACLVRRQATPEMRAAGIVSPACLGVRGSHFVVRPVRRYGIYESSVS